MKGVVRLLVTLRRGEAVQSGYAGTAEKRDRFWSSHRRRAPGWVVGGSLGAMLVVIGSLTGSASATLSPTYTSTYIQPTSSINSTITGPYISASPSFSICVIVICDTGTEDGTSGGTQDGTSTGTWDGVSTGTQDGVSTGTGNPAVPTPPPSTPAPAGSTSSDSGSGVMPTAPASEPVIADTPALPSPPSVPTTPATTVGGAVPFTFDRGEPTLPALPPPPPPPSVAVDVSGNGTVEALTRHAGPLRRTAASRQQGIKCGTAALLCYAQYTGKASLQFVAKPDPGYRFVNWGGACFGQRATCTLTVGGARSLRANFAPVNPGAAAKVTLNPPHVSVHWHQSVGSGRLVVSGTVSKSALIKLEFRRPAGGPLLTQQESVLAGRFSIKPALSAASLPKGAALLPGGFVLVLKGRVGSTALPQSLRTIVLPPPPEGVVRRAFTSRNAAGKPTPSIRFGGTSASSTFVFAAQPDARKKLSVVWHDQDGKVIAVRPEPNRPTVQTGVSSNSALPKGRWRVELRSGRVVIATHEIVVT
jgi:Divergent InlB B-repeat domain